MVDWKEWKDTMRYGFTLLPIYAIIGALSDDHSPLKYTFIPVICIFVGFYIIVRTKANKKEIYTSNGKLLDDKLGGK